MLDAKELGLLLKLFTIMFFFKKIAYMKKIILSIAVLFATIATMAENQYESSAVTNQNCSEELMQVVATGSNNSFKTSAKKFADKCDIAYDAAFGYIMPDLPEGTKNKFSFGFNINVGIRYNIQDDIFAEALLGYKPIFISNEYKVGKYSENTTIQIHDISIPIHIGYKIPVSFKYPIQVYAGPRIDIPVSSKCEIDNKKQDINVPTTVLIEGGVRVGQVNIRYGYCPSDKLKYSMISIGCAI